MLLAKVMYHDVQALTKFIRDDILHTSRDGSINKLLLSIWRRCGSQRDDQSVLLGQSGSEEGWVVLGA